MFNLKKFIHEEVTDCIAQNLSGRLINHKTYPQEGWYSGNLSIDRAVEVLWMERIENRNTIKQLQSDLAAIHAYYRDELCSDCCHADVCSKRESIKFGDKCEDKPLPCCLEVELGKIDTEYPDVIEKEFPDGVVGRYELKGLTQKESPQEAD